MLENYLLDHRWLLASVAVLVTAANGLIALTGQRMFLRQEYVTLEPHGPLGFGDRLTRSEAGQIITPLAFVSIVVAFALSLDRDGFGAIAGGLAVGQAVAAMLSLGTLLTLRFVLRAGSAQGELKYSAAYRYAASANQLLAGALIVWLGFFLRGGPMLFGGGLFLSILVVGYQRRARQVRKRFAQAKKHDAA